MTKNALQLDFLGNWISDFSSVNRLVSLPTRIINEILFILKYKRKDVTQNALQLDFLGDWISDFSSVNRLVSSPTPPFE